MDEAAVCPSGHTTNNRVLSLFAISRAMTDAPANPMACGADDCCATDGLSALGHGGACSCC
jgi:hypothetical protein